MSMCVKSIDYELAEKTRRLKEVEVLQTFLKIDKSPEFSKILKNDKEARKDVMEDIQYFYLLESGDTLKEDNWNDVVRCVKQYSKSLENKISNYTSQWGDDAAELKDEIASNIRLARQFAKDPTKQTLHQNVAFEYLKGISLFSSVENPINRGNGAYYIMNGSIKTGADISNGQRNAKSIDFILKYTFKKKNFKIFVTHKYTKGEGGAQDNQFADVIDFHKHARECVDDDVYFVSITDGAYYKSLYCGYNKKGNRIDFLNKKYASSRNRACSMDTLLETVIPPIIEWLESERTRKNSSEIDAEIARVSSMLN